MKKMIIAFTALVITATTQANTTHNHNPECGKDCPNLVISSVSPQSSSSSKMALVKNQAEEKLAQVQFTRTMQNALNTANRLKLEDSIKDLEAERAFNNLMAQTIQMVELEKLSDQVEDIAALERYENLMAAILNGTAGL